MTTETYTDTHYKNKAEFKIRHETVNVYWLCDHCGEVVHSSDIDMRVLPGGRAEKMGIDNGTDKVAEKGGYFMRRILRNIMYPVRRLLPSFLQGFGGDIEQNLSEKSHEAAMKASLTKEQKQAAIDRAWEDSRSGPGTMLAFHGEIRCQKCMNK